MVTPAFTSTSAAVPIDASGARFRWTPPTNTPGTVSVLLSRATDDVGSGRYVICRPADDGDFTIPANALDAFGVTSTASSWSRGSLSSRWDTAGEAGGLSVSRGALRVHLHPIDGVILKVWWTSVHPLE